MPHAHRSPTCLHLGVVAIAAALLAACGAPTEDPAAQDAAAVSQSSADAADDDGDAGSDGAQTGGADSDDEADGDDAAAQQETVEASEQLPADVVAREGGPVCHLPVGDAEPAEPATYTARMGEINGALEELVYELDADLTELEEGVADAATLEERLSERASTWTELTAAVVQAAPPEGAEQWHGQVTDSWVAVCEAIVDAQAGVIDGDDERFAAFAAALRDFPGLLNQLHANAAVGPFEQG